MSQRIPILIPALALALVLGLAQAVPAPLAARQDKARPAPAKPEKVKAQILILTGEADPFVPAAQVEAFKKELEAAKADYRVVVYPGAKHSFTNPDADKFAKEFNMPALAYNAIADNESWVEMQTFFKHIFAKK